MDKLQRPPAMATSSAAALVPQPLETGVAHVESLGRTRWLTKPPWAECLHSDRWDSRGDLDKYLMWDADWVCSMGSRMQNSPSPRACFCHELVSLLSSIQLMQVKLCSHKNFGQFCTWMYVLYYSVFHYCIHSILCIITTLQSYFIAGSQKCCAEDLQLLRQEAEWRGSGQRCETGYIWEHEKRSQGKLWEPVRRTSREKQGQIST